mgnify:CR=1 FL=1
MIDPKLLRTDPDRVRRSQRARGESVALVDEALAADEAASWAGAALLLPQALRANPAAAAMEMLARTARGLLRMDMVSPPVGVR